MRRIRENDAPTGRRPLWRRWLLRWAVSAAIGAVVAMVIWWLLTPYLWFWKYEQALDSADHAVRYPAILKVAMQEDARARDLVVAKLTPWLDGDDDRRFQTAYGILGAYGKIPAAAARPDLRVRISRILYDRGNVASRLSALIGLEQLRGIDYPEAVEVFVAALDDEDGDVRAQAIWSALRWNGGSVVNALVKALSCPDDEVAALAATGMLWADVPSGVRSQQLCETALGRVIASTRSSDLREAAMHTWAHRFGHVASDRVKRLISWTRDEDGRVAAAAVGLLDVVGEEAASRVREILSADRETLLTARAARVAGRMRLNDQAKRLRHWVYNAERGDIREAAAASLGLLDFQKKAEVLAAMLTNAVLEPGTSLDLAVMDAMRKSTAGGIPADPSRRWVKLLADICSKLPTDSPESLPASMSATTRAATLARQPMVACEAAVLLSEWAPDSARKFLWVQMDSPIVEIRDRAAVALGRILDETFAELLRGDLKDFSSRRRSSAALGLAVAGEARGLDRIESLLGRQKEHSVVSLYFRGALWIGGRDANGDRFLQWAAVRNLPPMSVMRIALLARGSEGLERLLQNEQDPRWSVDPAQLDEFFQGTRIFELLDGLLAGWGTPSFRYDPHADRSWRIAQCRRLTRWYQIHRGRGEGSGVRLQGSGGKHPSVPDS